MGDELSRREVELAGCSARGVIECRGGQNGLSGARLQRRRVEAQVRDDHVAHRVEGAPDE